MKKILYIGQIAIEGSASCTHVQNRARFFTNIGYDVYGLSECPKDKNDKANNTNFIKYIYMKPYPGKGKIRGAGWGADQFLGFHTYNAFVKAVKDILPYLEISLIAYAIKYFVLEFSVPKFIEAMFFISFWMKNEGAWYIAVVLILYAIYPLLYNIQKSPKGKLNIIAMLLIILSITLALGYIKEPWKYNVNYSYIGHFGGPLLGAFCFIVGSLVAEESLNLNEYSYLLVMVMAMIWPLSKLNPTIRYSSSISLIASVFLGMSGVFIFPLGFQRMPQKVKEKSLSFLRIMGGVDIGTISNKYLC